LVALGRREDLAAVVGPLRARGRVGAHLYELGRRVVAQLLAQPRRAARVAHRVVEGEPRLGRVAPHDARVEDGARRRAVGTRCAGAVGLAPARRLISSGRAQL